MDKVLITLAEAAAATATTQAVPASVITLGDVVTVGSLLTAAGGTYASGQAQQTNLDYQAAVYDQQSTRERELSALQAERLAKDNAVIAGRQRLAIAGSGGDPSTGSALLLQTEFAKDAAFEEQVVVAGGDIASNRLKQQASLARLEGAGKAKTANIRAGSTLLKGAVSFG